MPEQERKSLMIAMTLHEKGKSALKKEDYAKALVFFLDADNEFGYYFYLNFYKYYHVQSL